MYSRAYKWIVSAPPLLWVGIFLLLPYALMLAHSFWLVRVGMIAHEWNLQNYAKLFKVDRVLEEFGVVLQIPFMRDQPIPHDPETLGEHQGVGKKKKKRHPKEG